MKALVAIGFVLALVAPPSWAGSADNACQRWAQRIVAGDRQACAELCPQATRFDHYNYRKGLSAAFKGRKGLDAFLAYLDRASIVGAGAEAHACSVRALLEHWGDTDFANSLGRQSTQAKEQAVGLIDYTALADFETRFPKTYALAPLK